MEVNVKGFKGGDRLDLKLPDTQEELLKTICGLGKPVILVLLNGSALAVNWADEHIPAIVEAWYPGQAAGKEVVQLYVSDVEASVPVPIRSLQGFLRIYLEPGAKKTVNFVLAPRQLSLISLENKRVVEPGVFEVVIGGKQPGFKGTAGAPTTGVITGKFEVSVEVKKN
ncbi:MAG: fibronectin type III-like domain-contianing protein, partial [Acidobacteriota bacterium]|nr:fibronectin type III-like domain-contianing protein [Acidobacteriota bacterium]